MPLLLLALIPLSLGQDPDTLLAEARAAERAGDVAAERQLCERLMTEAAESAPAQRCDQRLRWLQARQDADGSLESLAAFMAARRAGDGAALQIEALSEVPGLSPTLRAELHAWLAGSALQAGDPERALTEAERALRSAPELAAARRHKAQALAALGRWEEAEAVEAQGPTRSARPREGVQLARLRAWRGQLTLTSWLALLAFLLPAVPLARRGWAARGGLEPAGLAPLAVAILGAALLAGAWDLDAGLAIAATLPPLAALHLLSAGAGLALARPARRAALGLGAALASAGSCFLVLDGLGALDGVLP